MTRKRVAIIGAGFSGVAVAAQLMRQAPRPDVVLIERGRRFGPGLAYATSNPAHVLNVRASNMSAFADQPDDFARWLKGSGAPLKFAPRGRYGAYVEDVLRRAERAHLFGGVKRVRSEAIACRGGADGWRITLTEGLDIEADAVVLALGNPSASGLPALEASGVAAIDPWDAAALRRIPRGDVLIAGAGLSMIDVALALADRRRDGTIYAISRRGLIPRAHLDPPQPMPTQPLGLPMQLSHGLHALRREARRLEERGEPWQFAIDRLRQDTPALWNRMRPEVQARFLRHLRPWWDVHRHRAAPEIARRVAALRECGRLRVLAGVIVSATQHGRSIAVQHRQRGSLVRHRLEVGGVVNCTGANLDLTRCDNPLVVQLFSERVARPHANGLGFDVDYEGRIIGDAGPHANLFTLGPTTQGAFWESTAVPEIRVRAAQIAGLL